MKRESILWKRVGLLVTGAVLLCGLAGLACYLFQVPFRSALGALYWKNDPALAAEVARDLLDFDLPPGYRPEKVLKLKEGMADAVVLVSEAHPSDLILISQTPDGILSNDAWRTKYEERGAHAIAGQFYDTETTGTQPATVRGQSIPLRLLEGTDQSNRAVRQLACMFQGERSEILLVIVAGRSTWDPSMVEEFLHSIR